jgi:flagellar M-ring protein FliF
MDFLNKAFAQVVDLFRSMTPGARITTVLLLAAVAVSLGYLFNSRIGSQDVYLMNGEFFAPSQIQSMEAAFGKANLNSHQWEGNRLRVPRSQQNAYTSALADNNALPDNYHTIVERMLDKMANPMADKQQRDLMKKLALQKQLEMILRGMTGVQNAFVLYDSETRRGFQAETLSTASVSITPKPGEQLDDAKVMAIRSVVAKAIAGLSPANVAVTDLSTGLVRSGSADGRGGSASAVDDPHYQRKKAYEGDLAQKIRNALSYVPGALVQVNVELDPKLRSTIDTIKHDPKSVPLKQEEESKTHTSETAGPGGRPGYAAQQPNSAMNLSAGGKGNKQEEEESRSTIINTVGGTHETSESAGLTPRKATASIIVPMSYYVKVWRERNPKATEQAPDQAALDQIRTEKTTEFRNCVLPLLPQSEPVADPSSLVQVTSVQDITPAEIPQPSTKDYAAAWLAQNWTTVGMIVLAGIAMLMLRSMVRSAPAAASAQTQNVLSARIESPTQAQSQTAEGDAETPQAEARLRRFSAAGPSLRDELSQLVQSDPDAAANVLRTWIGNAGVPNKT